MKSSLLRLALAACLTATLQLQPGRAFAQGTAFTYQGRLNDGAEPANGLYDLRFTIYDALNAGTQKGGMITNSATTISNGLFTVTLDFGNQFPGADRWLQIDVRTNGGSAFSGLSPRQPLTPTPYSVFAETAKASGLSGTIPAGNLLGTYGNSIAFTNAGNSFSGDGAGLLNVNAQTLGGLDTNSFWRTGGNGGTLAGVNFLGTTDGQPLEFHVGGNRALRLEPGSGSGSSVIGGLNNSIGSLTSGDFIGGGLNNSIGTGRSFSSVVGGYANYMNSASSVIGGGSYNYISGNSGVAIGGGSYNTNTGQYATIPGGYKNVVSGAYSLAAGQNAQALHAGSFVWADDSTSTPFVTTTVNQFLVRADYVGINRSLRISGAEFFGVRAPVTNSYGGMYMETAGTGQPFYGYAQNGSSSTWTYLDGNDGNKWKLYNNGTHLTVTPGGNVGINTTSPSQALEVNGEYMMVDGQGEQAYIGGDGSGGEVKVGSLNSSIDKVAFYNAAKSTYMHLYCSSITIEGGADLAEPFPISAQATDILEGSVVVIDEANPGHLKLSDHAYDGRVAGVVSGANGIHPGIQMQQQGLLEGGKNVALTGRVYVQADTTSGPIKPGDLLTTSDIPGHAMRVADHAKSQGAILGKAMTGLSQDKGMVLVLVTLQ